MALSPGRGLLNCRLDPNGGGWVEPWPQLPPPSHHWSEKGLVVFVQDILLLLLFVFFFYRQFGAVLIGSNDCRPCLGPGICDEVLSRPTLSPYIYILFMCTRVHQATSQLNCTLVSFFPVPPYRQGSQGGCCCCFFRVVLNSTWWTRPERSAYKVLFFFSFSFLGGRERERGGSPSCARA